MYVCTLEQLLLATLNHLGLLVVGQPHGNVAVAVLRSAAARKVHAGASALDDDALDFFLLEGPLPNALLDRAAGDEAVDGDLPGLAQPVCSVHGLRVNGWIPIRVVEDDRVGGREVDAEATRAGGQQEDEDLRPSLEVVHGVAAVLQLGRTVQSAVLVVAQDAMALRLELEQQLVQLGQLAAVGDEALHGGHGDVGEALLVVIWLGEDLVGGVQLHRHLLLDQGPLVVRRGSVERLADMRVEHDVLVFGDRAGAVAGNLDGGGRRARSGRGLQPAEAGVPVRRPGNVHQAAQDALAGDIRQGLPVVPLPDLEQAVGGRKVAVLLVVRHAHGAEPVAPPELVRRAVEQVAVRGLVDVARRGIGEAEPRERPVAVRAGPDVLRRPDVHHVVQGLAAPAGRLVVAPGLVEPAAFGPDERRQLVVHQASAGVADRDGAALPDERRGFGKVPKGVGRGDLGALEQVRVVADLPELHHQVHQGSRVLVVSHGGLLDEIHDVDLVAQVAVVGSLPVGEIAEDVHLNLVAQLLLHVLLHAAEHERLQDHVEALQLVLVELGVALRVGLDVLGKPFAELVVRIEERRHDEVQQGPQLLHVVLDGGAGEQQAVPAVEAEQALPAGAGRALDGLGLVENHVLPSHLLEVGHVGDDELVRRDADVEGRVLAVRGVLPVPELPEHLSVAGAPPVREDLELGDELCDFLLPVVQRGGGRHHQERPPDVVLLGQVGHDGDGLDRLAEAHFVRQDAVDALLVEVDEPVEALELVLLELGVDELGLLDLDVAEARGVLEVHLALLVHVQALVVEIASLLLGLGDGVLGVGHGGRLQGGLVLVVEVEALEPVLGDLVRVRRDVRVVGAALHLVRLDLLADEVRVELGLGDEEVELPLLAGGFAVGLLLPGILNLLLLGGLAQVALLPLVAFPEAHHVAHDALRAGLKILGALVRPQLPALGLLGGQDGRLLEVGAPGCVGVDGELERFADVLAGHVAPNLVVNLVVALGDELLFEVRHVVGLFLVLVLGGFGLFLAGLFLAGLFLAGLFLAGLFAVGLGLALDLDADPTLLLGRQLLAGVQGRLGGLRRVLLGLLLLLGLLGPGSAAALALLGCFGVGRQEAGHGAALEVELDVAGGALDALLQNKLGLLRLLIGPLGITQVLLAFFLVLGGFGPSQGGLLLLNGDSHRLFAPPLALHVLFAFLLGEELPFADLMQCLVIKDIVISPLAQARVVRQPLSRSLEELLAPGMASVGVELGHEALALEGPILVGPVAELVIVEGLGLLVELRLVFCLGWPFACRFEGGRGAGDSFLADDRRLFLGASSPLISDARPLAGFLTTFFLMTISALLTGAGSGSVSTSFSISVSPSFSGSRSANTGGASVGSFLGVGVLAAGLGAGSERMLEKDIGSAARLGVLHAQSV
ncbi:hypothetical protein Trco_008029 [Trichoderma cornu-damae]|uniref:Uncharacterized protein n=1 Tax=Trichoderma cornu-damae TaxID=654480 RepID=A0A9P8QF36_9HYPO|nr:hypothetical protein Trco_008029 [Trichoderma cornu-damae]